MDRIGESLSALHGVPVQLVGTEKSEDDAQRAVPGTFDVAIWCRGEGRYWFRRTLREELFRMPLTPLLPGS